MCPKQGFGQTYKVSDWNAHHKYYLCNTQISRDFYGELAKRKWNNPWCRRIDILAMIWRWVGICKIADVYLPMIVKSELAVSDIKRYWIYVIIIKSGYIIYTGHVGTYWLRAKSCNFADDILKRTYEWNFVYWHEFFLKFVPGWLFNVIVSGNALSPKWQKNPWW